MLYGRRPYNVVMTSCASGDNQNKTKGIIINVQPSTFEGIYLLNNRIHGTPPGSSEKYRLHSRSKFHVYSYYFTYCFDINVLSTHLTEKYRSGRKISLCQNAALLGPFVTFTADYTHKNLRSLKRIV